MSQDGKPYCFLGGINAYIDHHLIVPVVVRLLGSPVLRPHTTAHRWMGTDFIYFIDIPWYPSIEQTISEGSDVFNNLGATNALRDVAARVLEALVGTSLPNDSLPLSAEGQPVLSEEVLWALLLPKSEQLRKCDTDALQLASETFHQSLSTATTAIDKKLVQDSAKVFDRKVFLAVGILLYGLAHWANAVLHDEKQAVLLLDSTRMSQDLINIYREELCARWGTNIGYELDRFIDGGLPFIAYASHSTPTNTRIKLLEPKDYAPLHRSPECQCAFIQPPLLDVTRHLAEGRVPVMVLDGDRLTVWDSLDVEYASISHVWADGLGSTAEVGLPTCQVTHIASLARRLVRSRAFWLDALCIPKEETSRKHAIALMAQTYKNAAKVLVMDGGIQTQCSLTSPKEECILRIATSGWMQRIWTLPEGMLARELYFEVSDGLIDVTHFNGPSFHLARMCIPLLRRRPQDLPKLEYHSVLRDPPRCSYRDMIALLRHRKASEPSDESLAIAGLLGIDAAELVAISDGDVRMRILLIRCGTLPRCVAVYGWCSRRLDIPNFRWAPSSITDVLWQGDEDQSFATCTETGLFARYTVISFPVVDMRRLLGIVVTVKGDVLLQTRRRGEEFQVVSSRTIHIQLSSSRVTARIQSGLPVSINAILITDRALPTRVSEQAAAGVFISAIEDKGTDRMISVTDTDPLHCQFIAAGKVEANDHVSEGQERGGWTQVDGVMHSMVPVRLT